MTIRLSTIVRQSKDQVSCLQPELELLVACGRLAIDKVSLLLDSSGPRLNWNHFYQLAAVQGVLSQALHSLSLSNAVGIPEALMVALRRDHRDRVARDLSLTAETLRLVRGLETRGVASIVLKGCAISNSLYPPNPELRHSTDIDLLVSSHDFFDAEYYLRQYGYIRKNPKFEPRASARCMVNYLLHAYTYVNPKLNIAVDLHQRLTANPYWMNIHSHEIFKTSVTIKLPAGEIKGLGLQVLTPYLCCHALGHGFMRLSWINDVARVFDQIDASQAGKMFDRAKVYGADGPLILASRVLTRLHGGETPFSRFAVSNEKLAGKEDIVLKRIAQGKSPNYKRTIGSLSAELSSFVLNNQLSSRPEAKVYNLASLLCDARDTCVLQASPKWLLLYFMAGPLLSMGRFILRGATSLGQALRLAVGRSA